MNHARAFGAAEHMNALAGHFEGGGSGFGSRVGGADGERKFCEGTRRRAAIAGEGWKRAEYFFARKLNANYPR
jgi:hypothetical protein